MSLDGEVTRAFGRVLATCAVAVSCGGSLTAYAQQAPAAGDQGTQQLQQVVITGSLISRTNVETPSPVQVISSKDLAQSGYTDFSDILRNVSANGASTLSQSFSFAFAAGASGVSLRGLSVGDTLVLIDGERTVPYPLLDDNQRSFVDLSSIPFTAIERVDVLKDGASGLYGADAIAGVVNVILRKEYQGLKVSAETGTSEKNDGTMEHIGFIGGHGSLESDGYNWYLSGDFRHQDDILDSHRGGLWNNLDWVPWGGFNRTPGAAAAENPVVAYPGSTTGYVFNPNPANGLPAQTYLPGCSAAAQAADMCTFTVPQSQLQPPTTAFDLLGKFTKSLSAGWQFGLQASYFDSRSQEVQGLNPLSLLTVPYAFTNYPTGLFNFAFGPGKPLTIVPNPPLVITVPANYPGNPYGAAAPLVYNFHELGPGIITTDTATERLLASLSGAAAGWSLKATAGAMYSRMIYKEYAQVEPQALQTALNNGYILGSSDGTSLFAPSMETTPTSTLDILDVHGTHQLVELPGGPLDLALGVQWFKKVQNETAPPTAVSGVQYENGGPIYVIGTQKDTAAFAEVDGQIIRQLEIDGAVRFDHYNQFGSDTTPKIGVKFTPWNWVALRGTWGKGFRTPSAAEGEESGEIFGAGAYDDPVLCPNPAVPNTPGNFPSQCAFFLQGFQLPGTHLKNVKSTNWTTGIILQPLRQASVSVDYYNVKIENDVISAFEAGGLSNYTSIIRGPQVVLPYVNSAGQTVDQQTPVGTVLVANYPYVNAGSTSTSGWDVDLKAIFDAGVIGKFTSEATWTHELTYQLTVNGNTYELAGTHGPAGVSGDTGNPKDRGTLREAWDRGPFDLTASLNYIGHFSIIDPSSGYVTCAAAITAAGNFPGLTPYNTNFCTVKYFLTTDLYGSYQLTDSLQFHASILNLFNKQPPVDVETYGGGSGFYPYDPGLHQAGAVGRFFTLGASYEF
ncbi:MAG: TonB-dependent receptor plug domain-containing protein [Steroidobacteraceae bacterium]